MIVRCSGSRLAFFLVVVLLCVIPAAAVRADEAPQGILGALHVGVGMPLFGTQGVAVGNSSASDSYSGGSRITVEALYDFNPDTRFGMGGYYRRVKSDDDWVANAGGILLGWTWPTRSGLFTQLTFGLGVGKVDVDLEAFEGAGISTEAKLGFNAGLDFKLFYPVVEIARISGERPVKLAPFVAFSSDTTMGRTELTTEFFSANYDLTLGAASVTLGVTTVILR